MPVRAFFASLDAFFQGVSVLTLRQFIHQKLVLCTMTYITFLRLLLLSLQLHAGCGSNLTHPTVNASTRVNRTERKALTMKKLKCFNFRRHTFHPPTKFYTANEFLSFVRENSWRYLTDKRKQTRSEWAANIGSRMVSQSHFHQKVGQGENILPIGRSVSISGTYYRIKYPPCRSCLTRFRWFSEPNEISRFNG